MTRKSKREIESTLDEFDGGEPASVREWVNQYVVRKCESGLLEFTTTGRDATEDEVCIWDAALFPTSIWAPREDVPEWIDPAEDLPVIE